MCCTETGWELCEFQLRRAASDVKYKERMYVPKYNWNGPTKAVKRIIK